MSLKILVTGGAGFIGSHLVDLLISKGHSVSVVDDLSGGFVENLNPHATFFQADIRDFDAMDRIFAQVQPTVVYHLAANAAESKAQFSPIDITSRNHDGAIKVVTAAIRHGLKRFIFTSSIAVYGALQTPFKESDLPEPEDIYGITKYSFEESLKVLADVHNFEYVITRPHNVYGPRQNMRDPYRNVVTIFMNALLRNQPLYIYGSGDQVRCFSYVSDVVEALARCAAQPVAGMTFNLGSDVPYTVNNLAQAILKTTNSHQKLQSLPLRPREVMQAVSDHTLSKKHLQYKDSVSLASGLEKTWQWVQEQGPQEPQYTPVELESSLVPANWRTTTQSGSKPLVSIVIVTYKEDAELLACLQSIFTTQQHSRDPKFEVIVADNNIQGRLQPILAKQFPLVRYISAGDNIGFGPANNVGASLAQGEDIFFLNPDTELEPGAVPALVRFLQNNPRAAVVAPTLYDLAGNFYPDQGSAELTPITAVAAHSVLHRVWPSNPVAKHYWVKSRDVTKPQKLAVVPGTAFMIRRTVFEQIGGFDEQFFIYFEESDLCRRVRALGHEVWLTPDSHVRHIWHAATQDAKYNIIYRQSRFKYFAKYYGVFWACVLELMLNFGKRQAAYMLLGGGIALGAVILYL